MIPHAINVYFLILFILIFFFTSGLAACDCRNFFMRNWYQTNKMVDNMKIQYEYTSPTVMSWCTPIMKNPIAKDIRIVLNKRISGIFFNSK